MKARRYTREDQRWRRIPDDLTRAFHGLQRRLREDFSVAALYVFGSVARGDAVAGSDVDLLVEFEARRPLRDSWT